MRNDMEIKVALLQSPLIASEVCLLIHRRIVCMLCIQLQAGRVGHCRYGLGDHRRAG